MGVDRKWLSRNDCAQLVHGVSTTRYKITTLERLEVTYPIKQMCSINRITL